MTTMLDKVAVAGDITQAIDRTGCWACALTVIGGTDGTAVKLQCCDTADGIFEDFKELIPSSEASAEQYKGFVVDLFGAKKFVKVTGATMATAVFGDCDHDVKSIQIKAGEVPSGADLENNKAVTIDVSAYTEPVVVNPTSGKDGMKKTTVTLDNIPSGGEVEANKTVTIDVSNYSEPIEVTPTSPNESMAKATVTLSNIPSGGNVTLARWDDNNGGHHYLNVNKSPEDGYTIYTLAYFAGSYSKIPLVNRGDTYAKTSDTVFTITDGSDNTVTYTRNSEGDVTIW